MHKVNPIVFTFKCVGNWVFHDGLRGLNNRVRRVLLGL